MISVPYNTLKAYIIREADIICQANITRSARNGYHCKKRQPFSCLFLLVTRTGFEPMLKA